MKIDAGKRDEMLWYCIDIVRKTIMVRKKPLRVARKKPPGIARTIKRRERLLGGLPDLKGVLRGSLVARYRCGVKTCHCAVDGDPGHGRRPTT
jgi:hypothetical protein